MELFIQMNKVFGTTIILATHNKKLLETYHFPVITIENHHVAFTGITGETESSSTRKWKGPKPQSADSFSELSKQFEDLGNS
jgi:ABC-type phosphate/phosphonate transport system ATPase subunit